MNQSMALNNYYFRTLIKKQTRTTLLFLFQFMLPDKIQLLNSNQKSVALGYPI
jgi:hypothetical protein